jgi:hypothetical protein
MRSSLVSRLTLASLLLALVAGGTACKSGVGERCQVNADCEDGLVCVKNTDTCAESIGGDVDGGIDAPLDASEADATDPDASPIDATELDAAVDASPDA